MVVGSFGSIVFEVSADRVRTWNSASRQGRARWARHEVLSRKPLMEHTGPDLEQFELSIRLDAAMGINPGAEINALRDVRDNAEPQVLTLGGNVLGKFALENLSETWGNTDARGRLVLATVQISLVEYIDEADSLSWRGFGGRGLLGSFETKSLYSSGASTIPGLGDFGLSSLLPGAQGNVSALARAVLANVNVSDVLGRIPGVSALAGMTEVPRAKIGAVLAGLPVPADFSAAGMKNVFTSLALGRSAPADLLKTYSRIGLDATGVAQGFAADAPGMLKTVTQKVSALPDIPKAEAVAAMAGRASSRYMGQAVNSFAVVL